MRASPESVQPRRESIDPRGLLTSAQVPVAIMIGSQLDDSAAPPTYERNRFVADLVLHYSCAPFFSPSPLPTAGGGGGAPARQLGPPLSLPLLSAWSRVQPPSKVFLWYAERFPLVGADELGDFHEKEYVRYLSLREAMSDVDERAADAKRRRSEALQPAVCRRGSVGGHLTTAAPDGIRGANGEAGRTQSTAASSAGDADAFVLLPAAAAPPPVRQLPDLIPVPLDETYGLVNDAAPFLGLWRTVQATVSGTLAAVRWLLARADGEPAVGCAAASAAPAPHQPSLSAQSLAATAAPPVNRPQRFAAVHWFGGRHHAKCDAAGGFCFANDVVLGAMRLHRGLPLHKNKVLIVDLDAHHGDGTQEAFLYDSSYYTLSVHGYGTGFYPGTGAACERGAGAGLGYCANVPLPEGATDQLFVPEARHAIRVAVRKLTGEEAAPVSAPPSPVHMPSSTAGEASGAVSSVPTARHERDGPSAAPQSCLGAVVLVCGADGLQGDELGRMNYSLAGLQCVARLAIETAAHHDAKLLVLGAGGYVNTSAARLAGVVTRDVLSAAAVLQARACRDTAAETMQDADLFVHSPYLKDKLSVPVPDGCEYFTRYGPSFLMHGLPDARVPRTKEPLPRRTKE